MQLKIVTPTQNYRFSQTGQQLEKVTEPFVLVEANTRDDIQELYDPNDEHLAKAFAYDDDGNINGLNSDPLTVIDAIQNFLLMPGAWYLEGLHDPQTDQLEQPTAGEEPNEGKSRCSGDTEAQASTTLTNNLFVPNDQQRHVLRQLRTVVDGIATIQPHATDTWPAQVQKRLISQQLFGNDEPEVALSIAQKRLSELQEQAKGLMIPEEVIQTNMSTEPNEAET